jgi:hypothetical protein
MASGAVSSKYRPPASPFLFVLGDSMGIREGERERACEGEKERV